MVVSAQQDPVGKVGAVGVSGPEQDVVAFEPGCWSVAVGEYASAVPGSQGGALLCRVEPLFPAHVQRWPVLIEVDRLGVSCLAPA